MLEVVGRHPNYESVRKDPFYQMLRKRTNNEILTILEDMRNQFQLSVDAQNEQLVPSGLPGMVTECDLQTAMERYPDISSLSILDDLPSAPTHQPNDKSHEAMVPSVQITSGWKTTSSTPKDKELLGNTETAKSTQSQVDQYASRAIQLPPQSNNEFTPSMTVEPNELASWLTRKENPPSVLLLDVRPRDLFNQACIKHKWIVQIEPLVLRRDVSSHKIQDSLVLNPDAEQQLFARRQEFDLIVFYDQRSFSFDSMTVPLQNLKSAIYDLEYSKKLVRAPKILAGGLDAWINTIGHRGVYSFNNVKPGASNHVQPTTKPAPGGGSHSPNSSMLNHTLYDYFNQSQRTGHLQSMSGASHGVYGHHSATYHPSSYSRNVQSMPLAMPMPQYHGPGPTQQKAPNANTATSLKRHNTFIDNPFHGFTATTAAQYDSPPIPVKPTRPLPPPPTSPSTNVMPLRPSTVGPNFVNTPSTDSTFSKLGGVLIGTTGLKNLGNTCYMNSIIQCLSGTIPFARYFISGAFKQHVNKHNPLGTGGVLADSFAELLRVMWSESYNFISPVTFRGALVRFAPQYSGTEQQDSQEFLNFLLDGLHEDLNASQAICPPSMDNPDEEKIFEQLPDYQASGIAWEKYLQRNASVVVSLFQGQYRSRLTCHSCKTTSTTYNTFMSLSLPIPSKRHKLSSSVTLYQCLDYFVKDETLDKADAWHCPKCKKLRKATKTLTLAKLPDVLLIHLKRFSFDGPFRNKLETNVDFPTRNLDLSHYVPKSMNAPNAHTTFNYDLYAVSNHFGSLTGGHYTASVRNGYRGEWHNFDDTRFSVCDESKVKSRAAYNLFYVRSTIK
ncbi:hypothetical protein BC940DRAFT_293258 [Gongronella butleri]|nr:hypothetical protein BC940DRAFT_293258 [Gongronella butleri]